MRQADDNSTDLFRYLLGELLEDEESRVEKRVFRDTSALEEVRAAEQELIDSYVRGELTGTRKESFEKRFLAQPDRRARVLFADALATSITRRKSRDVAQDAAVIHKSRFNLASLWSQYPQLVTAGILVVIVAIGFLLWLNHSHRQKSIAPEVAQEPESKPDKPAPEQESKPDVTPAPTPHSVEAVILLKPVRLRGDRAPLFMIPSAVRRVRLVIELRSHDFARYDVILQTPEGGPVWHHSLEDRNGKLSAQIDASLLQDRGYRLLVRATAADSKVEDVGDYYFQVHRK